MTSSTSESPPQVIVDPRFAIEWRDIADFLGEFGPHNGRYVPRYPSDWPNRLKAHVDELSIAKSQPVKRAALLERIRREAPLCTVPVGWRWEDEKPWSENVGTAVPPGPAALVVGQALDPTPFAGWSETIDSIRETRRRSWPFHGSVSEYVEFCRPLLVNSPAAYLIDPYLDPFSDATKNLTESLLGLAQGSRCYSIAMIVRRSSCGRGDQTKRSPPMLFAEIETTFKKEYRELVPKDRTLQLHLVNEGSLKGKRLHLHDRFFLTTHGAIQFGQGFALGNMALPKQNASVIERDHHTQLKQIYIDGVARFREYLPKVPGVAYPVDVNSTVVYGETTQRRHA